MRHDRTEFFCDKCGKNLQGSPNNLNIVTSIFEGDVNWARLHVKIKHLHGVHNDAKIEDADLCQPCAINLLVDALRRVQQGERASAGTEKSKEQGWTN